MKKPFLKNLFFVPVVISLCFLLSQCGFRLKHQNQLPRQLHTLHIASDQPYDTFVILLKQNFMQMRVRLTESHQLAPVTLKIAEARLTHSAPDITTSDKARTYDLTYRVVFNLEGPNGKIFLSGQQILVNKKLTLNPGQTLYSNNELNVVKREMQREAIILLLYRLETQQVREVLQ